eukprot:2677049-Pleurochrysis_carterae.AAC.1
MPRENIRFVDAKGVAKFRKRTKSSPQPEQMRHRPVSLRCMLLCRMCTLGAGELGSASGAGRNEHTENKRDVAANECPGALPVGACGNELEYQYGI